MTDSQSAQPQGGTSRRIVLHSLAERVAHWSFALATVLLIGSGWRIHNFSGFFGFLDFPVWMTIGGTVEGAQRVHGEVGLAGALLWHFAAIWLLIASLAFYLVWGVATGHFRRRFLPLRIGEVVRDITQFFHGQLGHQLGVRNAVQKLLYTVAVAALVAMVWSGLAIWKPVQLHALAWPLGGYVGARYIHFLGMAGLVGFLAVHLLLVALVPKTLPPMITGRASRAAVAPAAREGDAG